MRSVLILDGIDMKHHSGIIIDKEGNTEIVWDV